MLCRHWLVLAVIAVFFSSDSLWNYLERARGREQWLNQDNNERKFCSMQMQWQLYAGRSGHSMDITLCPIFAYWAFQSCLEPFGGVQCHGPGRARLIQKSSSVTFYSISQKTWLRFFYDFNLDANGNIYFSRKQKERSLNTSIDLLISEHSSQILVSVVFSGQVPLQTWSNGRKKIWIQYRVTNKYRLFHRLSPFLT